MRRLDRYIRSKRDVHRFAVGPLGPELARTPLARGGSDAVCKLDLAENRERRLKTRPVATSLLACIWTVADKNANSCSAITKQQFDVPH